MNIKIERESKLSDYTKEMFKKDNMLAVEHKIELELLEFIDISELRAKENPTQNDKEEFIRSKLKINENFLQNELFSLLENKKIFILKCETKSCDFFQSLFKKLVDFLG